MQTLECSSDTVMEKFALELFANKTRADFRIWQVLRRLAEVDGMKVVWACIVEPVELDNKSFSSCAFQEKGYIVCKPSDHSSDVPQPDSSELLRCHRVTPYISSTTPTTLTQEQIGAIGTMIKFVLSLDSITSQLEGITDLLVRQSLNDRHGLSSCGSVDVLA